MQAVENAFKGKLSIVEGPPATGKTQTILNIIANLIIRDNDVLVASPNNSATDNVREKLVKQHLGFIAARLGNTANQEAFVANQPPYPQDLDKWVLNDEILEDLFDNIEAAILRPKKALAVQRQLACDQEELRQWELQQEFFLQHFGDVEPLGCREGVRACNLVSRLLCCLRAYYLSQRHRSRSFASTQAQPQPGPAPARPGPTPNREEAPCPTASSSRIAL